MLCGSHRGRVPFVGVSFNQGIEEGGSGVRIAGKRGCAGRIGRLRLGSPAILAKRLLQLVDAAVMEA